MLPRWRILLCYRLCKQAVNKRVHSKKKHVMEVLVHTFKEGQFPICNMLKICNLEALEELHKFQQPVHRTFLCNYESNFFLLLSKNQTSKFSMQKNIFLDYHLPSVVSSPPPSTELLMLVLQLVNKSAIVKSDKIFYQEEVQRVFQWQAAVWEGQWLRALSLARIKTYLRNNSAKLVMPRGQVESFALALFSFWPFTPPSRNPVATDRV